ncbi:MAG: 3-phosphoshikimate 1-carboxyvinyltransferase [Lachnospiraceae bacterium]|nr:3-phosphoshikimate 1-carboxyvinyltransferase [Lachnospiraceae bacterium]
MKVRIERSKAAGTISAPPSKSMAHRDIIAAALADGTSKITNVAYSEDIKATIDCVRELGAGVTVDEDSVTVRGAFPFGEAGRERRFMCRESGSTLRFMMGIALGLGGRNSFCGSAKLMSRPLGIYEDICKANGIVFNRFDDRIETEGKLSSGVYKIPGDVSSQFITGLLFVLPLLKGDSVILLLPPVESRSYINLTVKALKDFGVDIVWQDDNTLFVKGDSAYMSRDIRVEGDYSNAAFLDAFNLLSGDVRVAGLDADSLQGDRVYEAYYEELSRGHATLDLSDCPDLAPVLMSLAAALHGARFTGTRRLKVKESDRGEAMALELMKLGIKTDLYDNEIEVHNCTLQAPTEPIDGHNDHRIVMAMSLLLTLAGGVIEGAEAVTKSYPNFFEDIEKLGINVKKEC